jgi:hypothetical protein
VEDQPNLRESNGRATKRGTVGLIVVGILSLPGYVALILAMVTQWMSGTHFEGTDSASIRWRDDMAGLPGLLFHTFAIMAAIVLSARRVRRSTKLWGWTIILGALVAVEIVRYWIYERFGW